MLCIELCCIARGVAGKMTERAWQHNSGGLALHVFKADASGRHWQVEACGSRLAAAWRKPALGQALGRQLGKGAGCLIEELQTAGDELLQRSRWVRA